jgi:hypothetical protein
VHGDDLEPRRAQQPGNPRADRRIGVLAPGLFDLRVELVGVGEHFVPGRWIAEPVAGAVVRFGEDEAAAGTDHAAQAGDHRARHRHVLEDGHRESGVEGRWRERQARGVRSGKLRRHALLAHRPARVAETRRHQIDADEVDTAWLQRRQDQLRRPGTAADVEHALARLGHQRFLQERGEAGIPPAVAQVFERERRERVDVAGH